MTPNITYSAAQSHIDDLHRDARRHHRYEEVRRQMIKIVATSPGGTTAAPGCRPPPQLARCLRNLSASSGARLRSTSESARMFKRSWHLYLLTMVGLVLAVLAVAQIGPPPARPGPPRQIVTAEQGVVQSTVTGSGNIEAGSDVNVNFQTSGTLSAVDVHVGQHVTKGQLLGTLDPTQRTAHARPG